MNNIGLLKKAVKKLYNLGTFKTIEEAIEARREAEEEMYAPLIAKKNAYLAEHGL